MSARPETWGSCTSAWNSCGVKPMTLPRSFGTREAFDFSPAELDAVESRSDLLYRLKKEVRRHGGGYAGLSGPVPPGAGRYGDGGRHLARLEQQLEKARKAVLAAGAELTAARKEAAAVLEQRIQSGAGT